MWVLGMSFHPYLLHTRQFAKRHKRSVRSRGRASRKNELDPEIEREKMVMAKLNQTKKERDDDFECMRPWKPDEIHSHF